jgi:ankyrin repeat protein
MSLLIDALKDRGSPELLLTFLESGQFPFDFVREPESSMTALKAAMDHHLEKAVLDLIQRGSDVELADLDGLTPLMLACERNYKSAAREIASRLPDLEAVDPRGRTALSFSVRFSSLDMVQMMVQLGASVHTKDVRGCSLFFQSVMSERFATADYFQTEFDGLFSVHDRDAEGAQALHLAAMAGNAIVVKWLIVRGAELEAKGNFDMTPLMTASASGNVGVARVLVQAGADIDRATGLTSLGWAASDGQLPMIQELLLWGGDPRGIGTFRVTARQAALLRGHGGVVKLFDAWGSIPAVWVVLSAGQVRHISTRSKLQSFPKDLIRMVGSMLF